MHASNYICLMASKETGNLVASVLIPSHAHTGAGKEALIRYPDCNVVRITREWVPIGECHNCGAAIFKGDYENDRIHQRNGKNYCLECST